MPHPSIPAVVIGRCCWSCLGTAACMARTESCHRLCVGVLACAWTVHVSSSFVQGSLATVVACAQSAEQRMNGVAV